MDYRYQVVARKFDLNLIGQYLRDLVSGGTFTANLDVDLKATGNLKDEQNLSASGRMAINDFHFGKNLKCEISVSCEVVWLIAFPKTQSPVMYWNMLYE